MAPPVLDAHSLLLAWDAGPFALGTAVVLVAIATWYVRTVVRRDALVTGRSATARRWPRSRIVAFLAGLLAIEAALGSPVATLTGSRFTPHVIQHLLLMMIAPPLLALAAPMTLILQTTSRTTKRRILRVLHGAPFGILSHPVTVFFLYYASMFAFFLTSALGYAMDRMWLMDLINLGFLGGATLFWWPMVGADPIPRWAMSPGIKIINLLIGVPFESFLSVAIIYGSGSVAPMYSVGSSHTGGGVLWGLSELLTAFAMIPLFVQWSRADERAARHIDARIAAGESLAPDPAAHGLSATMKALRRG